MYALSSFCCCRLEALRAQRLQGDKLEQQALMTVAETLAAAEQEESRSSGRGRGRARGKSRQPAKRARHAESPENAPEPQAAQPG